MKVISEKLFDSADGSVVTNSPAFSIEHLVDVGLVLIGVGTLSGTMTIQVSNDIVDDNSSPTNWAIPATLDGTTAPTMALAGASANKCLNYPDCGFKWLRLNWNRTGGAGTITAIVNAKGA